MNLVADRDRRTGLMGNALLTRAEPRKPFYEKQPDRRASPYSGEAAQVTARSDFDAERGQDMADARGRHLACPIHIVEGRRGGGEDRSGPRRVPFHKLGGV